MAVIGQIRNRMGGLLVAVVGGALVIFVVSDFFDSGNKAFGGGDRSIGTIAGEEIDVQAFERRVDEQEEVYRSNGTTVDAQLQEQIRNNVWNEILRERTLLSRAKEAGFGELISREEFDDIRFGNNVLPDFKGNPNFQGADGQPDKTKLRQYFKSIQEQAPMFFELQKRTFVNERLIAKYNTLVKKSCFVNSAQVTDEFTQKNAKATFTFVAKRYDAEPDSLYTASEEDIRRYYDAHKNEKKWEQKASRSFDYVRIPVVASESDILEAQKELADILPAFQAAKGKDDSTFVMANADTKSAAATPYTEGSADKLNDSLITHADTGAVVGPFRTADTWKLVKVKELADVSEARVRHILLGTQGGKPEDEVKQRADSILAVVKRDKSKFEEMVKKYSEDQGSVQNGGVYEWFDKTRMVPEFTKASFDEKVGATTICKTSYGYHIVEVLGQRTRQERRVLTVDRKVRPDRAMKEAWKTASAFSLNNLDTASFRKSAADANLAYTPVDEFRADQRFVSGLQDANSVISYVNRSKIGDKPSEPLMSDESYVVALLTGIREEGDPRFEDVKEAMTTEVRKQKKAEALLAKMAGKTDLNALATELGISVQSASDMALSSMSIPGGFSDPEVIGRIFSVPNGQLSPPLKGDMAVYVANMTNLVAAGEMPENPEASKPLVDKVRNRAEYSVFNSLKEAAKIKDDRHKFF